MTMARQLVLRLVGATLAILLVHAASVYADPMRGGGDKFFVEILELLRLDRNTETLEIHYNPEEAASSSHAANQQSVAPAETASSDEPPYRFTQDYQAPNIPNLRQEPGLKSVYWPQQGFGVHAQNAKELQSIPPTFRNGNIPPDLVLYEADLLVKASRLLGQVNLKALHRMQFSPSSAVMGVYADREMGEWLCQVLQARQNRAIIRGLPTYEFELKGVAPAIWKTKESTNYEVTIARGKANHPRAPATPVQRTNKGLVDTHMADVLERFDIGPYTVAILASQPKWSPGYRRVIALPTWKENANKFTIHLGLLKIEKQRTQPLETEPLETKPHMSHRTRPAKAKIPRTE